MADTTPIQQVPEDILPDELPIPPSLAPPPVVKPKREPMIEKRVLLGKIITHIGKDKIPRTVLHVEPRLNFRNVNLEWSDILLPAETLINSKVALTAYCNVLYGDLTIQIPFNVSEVTMTRSYRNPTHERVSTKRRLEYDITEAGVKKERV